jgi:hypothetical protein
VTLSKTWNQIGHQTEGQTDLGVANERKRERSARPDSGDAGRRCTNSDLGDDSPDTRAEVE